MRYFSLYLPISLIGICCLLSACGSSQPQIVPIPKSLSEVKSCPVEIPTGFQEALQSLQLHVTAQQGRTYNEEVLLGEVRKMLFQESVPYELTFKLPIDSTINSQSLAIKQATAWQKQDFASVVKYATAPGAAPADPATLGLSQAFAATNKQQRLDFRQRDFTVPLELSSTGSPTVEVELNGQTFRFWIDTGAGVSVLSSAVAEKIGLRGIGDDAPLNTSTKHKVQAQAAYLDSLNIGAVRVFDHPCVVLNEKDLRFRLLGITLLKIDGIIGWPLLQALDLEMDLPNKSLRIRKPVERPVSGDDASLLWFWQPIVKIHSAQGCAMHLFLDTGSETTFFHPSAYSRLGIVPKEGGKMRRAGAGGSEVVAYDRLDSCRIILDAESVLIARSTGVAETRSPEDIFLLDGVLGQDILKHGVLRLDVSNRRFSFRFSDGFEGE